MAKFVAFFSYRAETWNRLVQKPSDRSDAIQAAITCLGGSVETVYYTMGEYDGMVIVEMPDLPDVAAISIAVMSTGAFTEVEIRSLIDPTGMPAILEKAGRARDAYAPPGS